MKIIQTLVVIASLAPLASCTNRDNQALRSGEPNMAPNGSPALKGPAQPDVSKPADYAAGNPVIDPKQPELAEALKKQGYSADASAQAPGGPEDLHAVVGTRQQSDRGRLHTTGAAAGVSNPSTATDHNVDINRNVERSKK